jgi:hypothetical protein
VRTPATTRSSTTTSTPTSAPAGCSRRTTTSRWPGAGLAAGQKNAPELADDGAAAGFDFAVTEECGAFDECTDYLAAYAVVLDVEYTDAAQFGELCDSGALPPHAVRRDVGLTIPGSPDYVFERCPD